MNRFLVSRATVGVASVSKLRSQSLCNVGIHQAFRLLTEFGQTIDPA